MRLAHFKHGAVKLEEECQEFHRKAFQAAACWFCVCGHIPCCTWCKNYPKGLFIKVRVQKLPKRLVPAGEGAKTIPKACSCR